MKYFSILKDSFREAIDTKVFYATLGISCLVVLLIGSVTFRPLPVEEQVSRATRFLTGLISFSPQAKGTRYHIENFEATTATKYPWQGDYRFDYVIRLPAAGSSEDDKQLRSVMIPGMLKNQFEQQFPWIDKITVVSVADTGNHGEVRSRVELHGTKVKDRRDWPHQPALLFGLLPLDVFPTFTLPSLAGQVSFIADFLIGTFAAAIIMLLSTIITGFFIPNMLRKGTIDLLLAKPIRRSSLLVYKWIGGMTFMFLNTLVIMVGIWLALGLQTELWLNGLLWCIPIFTFQFAIFYAMSTLLAVLTRSPIVAILTAVLAWALCFFIGWGYRILDNVRPEKLAGQPQADMVNLPRWVFVTADLIHLVTPRYKDLDVLTSQLINRDLHDADSPARKQHDKAVGSINWPESIGVTLAFIVVMMGLSCWRFAVKDY